MVSFLGREETSGSVLKIIEYESVTVLHIAKSGMVHGWIVAG